MINNYGRLQEADHDAVLEGIIFKDIPVGVSEVTHIFSQDCYFVGAAIYSNVTKIGTTLKLETKYQAAPGVWFRYKKFGKNWNLIPNYVCKSILFPTKPKTGISLTITVDNQEGTPIDLCMNMFNFVDIQEVKPSLGQQGEDW